MNNLEENMILTEEWNKAPIEAQKLAEEETKLGVPTGIGYTKSIGWYVIQSSGQGPYLIWKEND